MTTRIGMKYLDRMRLLRKIGGNGRQTERPERGRHILSLAERIQERTQQGACSRTGVHGGG